ncbi:MAG: nicotinate-nucleotide adenylyltransferase [Phycisphaerae bacterium]|nr:nicotinate-nucleotide adenylyltransferase [Phycisphaerae bacterium]
MKTMRRIILFGGSFDPIHVGHTTVVAHAHRHLAADTVIFVPARRSPLKAASPKATDADRMAMIARVLSDHPGWQVSDCELRRPAPSYTLDTIRHFRTLRGPGTRLYWLIGADTVPELPNWHGIDRLLDLCTVAAMCRAGCPRPDFSPFLSLWGPERVRALQENVIETPLVDVSSTRIRRRIAQGRDVSTLLHPGVLAYIHRHGLYRRSRSHGSMLETVPSPPE